MNINVILAGQTLYVRSLPGTPRVAFEPQGMNERGSNQRHVAVSICNGAPQVSIRFINLTTNAQRFLWDFGDGTSSDEVNPVHIFTIAPAGETRFSVTLTAYGWDNSFVETTLVLSFSASCP